MFHSAAVTATQMFAHSGDRCVHAGSCCIITWRRRRTYAGATRSDLAGSGRLQRQLSDVRATQCDAALADFSNCGRSSIGDCCALKYSMATRGPPRSHQRPTGSRRIPTGSSLIDLTLHSCRSTFNPVGPVPPAPPCSLQLAGEKKKIRAAFRRRGWFFQDYGICLSAGVMMTGGLAA